MQIVTELNLDVFCWWFLRRIESHFSPPFCWEYFWGLFQPLWPVATPSFWLESIMASQPILPPPDVACLILSGSLTIGFGQLNGPVNFRFLHPKSRLMRNFPKGSMVLTFFCSGSIWQHNFQTSWNQTFLKQNLWEPQNTYESCGFSQQVARWETGKTEQQKSMKKTQTELLHQEVHVPEKLPQAGGYDAACFFVGGLTVKTDVMCSSFIQIDLLISLKLGKDHLWVQTRSFWRTWLLLLLSNIVW